MKARDFLFALGATATLSALILLASPERVAAPNRPLAGAFRSAAAIPTTRPEAAPEALDHAAPPISGRFGEWQWIVVHHTGEPAGDVESLDRRHREELSFEDGLAFHFLVGNGNGLGLGAVAEGSRWTRSIPGPHCTENPGVSLASVGVAAIGDTREAPLPAEEFRALAALVASLRERLGLPRDRVLLHRDVEGGDPNCPGPHFDAAAFRAALDAACPASAASATQLHR